MKQYLVLLYNQKNLDKGEPRILYSGSNQTMANQLLEEYRATYKGYQITLVEVLLPNK